MLFGKPFLSIYFIFENYKSINNKDNNVSKNINNNPVEQILRILEEGVFISNSHKMVDRGVS